jgi:hypothetical protein
MSREREVRELLNETTCALCPNPIGSQEFRVLELTPDEATEVEARAHSAGTVIQFGDRCMMLIHVRCWENMRFLSRCR